MPIKTTISKKISYQQFDRVCISIQPTNKSSDGMELIYAGTPDIRLHSSAQR
jgi:hypothetical protein